MKEFADDKLNVTKMIVFVFDIVENIVGEGEIACTTQAISPFPTMFSKSFFPQICQKVSFCGNGLTPIADNILKCI